MRLALASRRRRLSARSDSGRWRSDTSVPNETAIDPTGVFARCARASAFVEGVQDGAGLGAPDTNLRGTEGRLAIAAPYGSGVAGDAGAASVEMVVVPGATLWTVSQGAGIPVVLCHGGPGLSDNLAPLADMVADRARVHRFDQRGGGRSHSHGPFDVASFVGDLDALREHWGHARWVVGGHSWGANLALFYALAHPQRTLGVIYLAGTGLRWGWQPAARRRRLSRLTAAEQTELLALESQLAGGDPTVRERFVRLMWTTEFADRLRARILDTQPLYDFARNEEVFRAASEDYRAVLDRGVEAAVRTLNAPVLVIHGAQDTEPARARRVAELAPRARWVELPDAAHSPWLEQPSLVRHSLRAFLEEL